MPQPPRPRRRGPDGQLKGPASTNAAAGEPWTPDGTEDYYFPLGKVRSTPTGEKYVPAPKAGGDKAWSTFMETLPSPRHAGVYISGFQLISRYKALALGDGKIVYMNKIKGFDFVPGDQRNPFRTDDGKILRPTSRYTVTNIAGGARADWDVATNGPIFADEFYTYNNWRSFVVLELNKAVKADGKNYKYIAYTGLDHSSLSLSQVGAGLERGGEIGDLGPGEKGKPEGIGIYFVSVSGGSGRRTISLFEGAAAQAAANVMNTFLSSVNENGELDYESVTNGGGGGESGPTGPTAGEIATAAAFSTYFQMPGLMEQAEAVALTGKRSLLNDKPLLPFVEQLAAGSLRNFMSMPNGDFYAFYPDYFGGLGRTAYWKIKDIEIIDGRIDLSDDSLATHVFVVGDTQAVGGELGFGTIDWIDRINTAGVVNVLNAFMADFLNGIPADEKSNRFQGRPSLAKKDDAIRFLEKYGARPYYEEAPAVRSPIYETFLAYQRFCLLWAAQFKTTFEFTFMPELFPGGLVELEEHGIQCYVEQVVHTGSYETGFRTMATLSAPSAVKDGSGRPVDPDKSWVHAGMIRAGIFNVDKSDDIGTPRGTVNTPARKPN